MSKLGVARRFVDPTAARMLAQAPTPRRALFLDRDGVINVNHGYVHSPARTDWVPGVFELVRDAIGSGYLPIVVTNQAGIARGLYTEADYLAYTAWMHDQFRSEGAPLLATYYCPHHPEASLAQYRMACACRKPEPGMLVWAIEEWGLDASGSMLVGDSSSDLLAGKAAGVGDTRLVQGGFVPNWLEREGDLAVHARRKKSGD